MSDEMVNIGRGKRYGKLIIFREQKATFVQREEGLCLKIGWKRGGKKGGSDVLRTKRMRVGVGIQG